MGVIAVTGATLIRAFALTWRIGWTHEERLAAARRHAPNVIFAFWHGRLLPLCYSHRNQNIQVLASRHRDGEMLGQVIRRLGFGHVRGSSTRGGARAIRELAGKIESGLDLGITVDGPKGPRYVVKPGPIQIAKLTGSAIVPITTSSRRHKTFSSWDAFELPLPFTRVRIAYGEPVTVPAGADDALMEAKRLEVEDALNRVTDENDRAVHE